MCPHSRELPLCLTVACVIYSSSGSSLPVYGYLKKRKLANGAIDRLKNAGLDPDRIDLQKMESDYAVMTADREKTSSAYKAAEKECEKLKKLRDDLTSYVGTEQSLDIERDVKRTL